MPKLHAAVSVTFLAALALAGCTSPAQPLGATSSGPAAAPDEAPAPTGGGRVLNAAPRVLEFAGSLASADNGGGSIETFTAVVGDDNAEADLASLALVAEGPGGFRLDRALAARDLQERAHPGYDAAGWAVWDAVPMDGKLQVGVRATVPRGAEPGTYAFTLVVEDRAGERARSAADTTRVDPVDAVRVDAAVERDGRAFDPSAWGGWSAAPGAQHVASATYLRVLNLGSAGTRFVVDFTGRDFVGRDDPAWRVPLDGNVRFAAWEGGRDQLPADGAFVFGAASPDGAATFAFTRANTVMYLAYEVVQVPAPLPSQVYEASATVAAG